MSPGSLISLLQSNQQKVLVNFHVASWYEDLRKLIILTRGFCLPFNAPFLEVAVFSPYLNLNIQMTTTPTLKRNIRCRSGSRRPILNWLMLFLFFSLFFKKFTHIEMKIWRHYLFNYLLFTILHKYSIVQNFKESMKATKTAMNIVLDVSKNSRGNV